MSIDDQFVCAECFDDIGIRQFIKDNAVSTDCSFCDKQYEDRSAISIDKLTEYIGDRLYEEYDMVENWLGRIDGEWVGKYWDTWDLLDKIGLDLPNQGSDQLLQELIHRLPDHLWCERDPYGLNDVQVAQFSWSRFCHVIQHERRFFFSSHTDGSEEADQTLLPGQVLERIFNYAEQVGLVRSLEVGTNLYRARYQHSGQNLQTAQDLGPPPIELAKQSNRMSPAGIVMFYGSDNPETALRETANSSGTYVVGRFVTHRHATVLDLAGLPDIPSLFEVPPESLEYKPRRVLRFLHHISEEISKPIKRDDRMHISYAPTQVVTEYIRSRLTQNGTPLDGIVFSSAVHGGHVSYVLFATRNDVFEEPIRDTENDPWIQLIDRSTHLCTQEKIDAWRHDSMVQEELE